jgi:hypothetical protein
VNKYFHSFEETTLLPSKRLFQRLVQVKLLFTNVVEIRPMALKITIYVPVWQASPRIKGLWTVNLGQDPLVSTWLFWHGADSFRAFLEFENHKDTNELVCKCTCVKMVLFKPDISSLLLGNFNCIAILC